MSLYECIICGKVFEQKGHEQTCSPECNKERLRKNLRNSHKQWLGIWTETPMRKCHDCGCPTTDYRCEDCQRKWRAKHGVPAVVDDCTY